MLSVNRIWKTTYSRDKLSQPYNGVVFGSVLPTIFQVIEVFKTKMGISISLAALMTSYSQQGRYVVAQPIEAFARWRKLSTTQQIILNDFSISPFGLLPSLWQSFLFSLFEWNSQRQNLSEHSLMYSVEFPERKRPFAFPRSLLHNETIDDWYNTKKYPELMTIKILVFEMRSEWMNVIIEFLALLKQ